MAKSPSHKFGQIIGEVLETALRAPLERIAATHGLYFDFKHSRQARGGKKKVAWEDYKGNTHDLDYVLEYGGTEEKRGQPKAFIEIAWRRYTKHSRNKAQEIHGAVIPLAETFSDFLPFLGVVLAGDFTSESLTQLKSNNFQVLYFPYETITAAFDAAGIDARFDETTPDAALQKKVNAYCALSEPLKEKIPAALWELKSQELAEFLKSLETALSRKIKLIRILPLHGSWCEMVSVTDAINFIQAFNEAAPGTGFVKYEISIRYTNADEVRGEFQDRTAAVAFLRALTG